MASSTPAPSSALCSHQASALDLHDLSAYALRELCKTHKLRHTVKTNKTDMLLRLQKNATQAVVYEGWTLTQLLREVVARRIDFSSTNNIVDPSAQLITMLEAVDWARTFRRFLDLPPELRNEVYMYAAVNETLVQAQVPAICHASQQLSRESRPIFRKFGGYGGETRVRDVEMKKVRCCHWAKSVGGCTRHLVEEGVVTCG